MINWSDIDTVLLDMDGTLLDLSFDNFFWLHHLPKRYSDIHQLDLPASHTLLEQKSTELKGSLNWYCVDHWTEDLGVDIDAMKAELAHLIRFRPHAPEFLTFLKEIDKQVILVTNAHPKSLQLKASSVDLHHYIDRMVSSHDFGLAKENTGFWPKLAQKESINLSRSLFIDDSLPVLQCAQQEGVGFTLQVLQPDTGEAANAKSDFPGIINFDEIMV